MEKLKIKTQDYQDAEVKLTPQNPNISMHNLKTIPYTCPKVLTGRIC